MTHNAPLNAARLLVSVRNAEEAVLAAGCQVGWIDVKNPANGSLGMPVVDVSRDITQRLNHHQAIRTSVALGELNELDLTGACQLMKLFAIGKVGLSGCAHMASGQLLERLQHIRSCLTDRARLVPALYADYRRAESPEPRQVLQLAEQLASPFLLVDTWRKDGLGLFHWLSVESLQELSRGCADFGAKLVVAGSLRTSDWPSLAQLGDVIIGIRGAVCRTSSDRTSQLCEEKLNQWQTWCSSRAHAVARPGS